MSNWKHKDNYPREKWGAHWEMQKMVDDLTYKRHRKHKHTDRCLDYSFTWFALICKFTGQQVWTDLQELNA